LGSLRLMSMSPAKHGALGALEDILVRMALARNDQSPAQVSVVSPARTKRAASLLRVLNLPDADSEASRALLLQSARTAWGRLLLQVATPRSASLGDGGGAPGPCRLTLHSSRGPAVGTHPTPALHRIKGALVLDKHPRGKTQQDPSTPPPHPGRTTRSPTLLISWQRQYAPLSEPLRLVSSRSETA
jgi:hypothetical protein